MKGDSEGQGAAPEGAAQPGPRQCPARLSSTLAMAVLNAAFDLLATAEEGHRCLVQEGWSDPRCSDQAIKHLITLRFGDKVAAPDPSDTEAMKRFQSQGGTIVVGLSKGSGPM
jgi:hypothetical protein